MLPVNVEGVTWLATNYTTYSTPIITFVLIYILGVLGLGSIGLMIGFFWIGLKENTTMLYLGICFVCCALAFFAIAHDEKKNQEILSPNQFLI